MEHLNAKGKPERRCRSRWRGSGFVTGYVFRKHFLALHEGYYPFRFPMIQVGQYSGTRPVEVTVRGKVRLDKALGRFTIAEQDVLPGRVTLARAWCDDQVQLR